MTGVLIYVVSLPDDPVIRMEPVIGPENDPLGFARSALAGGRDELDAEAFALHQTMRRAAALLDAMNSAGMRFPGIYVIHEEPE